uniref:G protein-coupled receptor n=1 Tax=Panagrolaimus davidi TaxID=227884 RepID=A0A914P7K6_9BILA
MHPDTTSLLNRINGIIAGSFGFVANIILIVFIFRSKRKEFRKVFLQIAIIDLILLFVTAAVEPLPVFVDGNDVIVLNGFFRHMPQPYGNYMTSAWMFGFMEPSALTFMGLLIGPFFVSLGIALIIFFGFTVTPDEEIFATSLVRDILLESGENTVHAASFGRKGSTELLLAGGSILCVVAATYIIIIFCITKIRVSLKNSQTTMSKETRKLQNQLSWIFGMQALCPLVVSTGPLTYLVYIIVTEGTAFWSMIWLITGFSWIPFINATLTLCFVGEFRQKIMFFKKLNSSIAPSNKAPKLVDIVS